MQQIQASLGIAESELEKGIIVKFNCIDRESLYCSWPVIFSKKKSKSYYK